ncbi:50S ribosomal protein L11 methyltransferase [Saccharicrinis aurantiacus]|uniref:50S ribosomal protein L11 methyltransferase n=1 Tax=Saccharicrinis aurantiacus TaxID=1849719 RepID=UPI00248F7438|nr:50S ribosomal protein L11 methyltransferase [Saccharicrinis aurantiacus]
MQYTKVSFTISPLSETIQEILIAELSQFAYDSFQETESGLDAYIPTEDFNTEDLETLHLLNDKNYQTSYTSEPLEDQNWNETWEKNYFQPIEIDDRCVVRSPFHTNVKEVEYNVLIDPKMAFGTGHHETTGLMIKHILEMDFTGKSVLDMGCGTAILGILCAMRNAKSVFGIDIEEWAYHNSKENIKLNHIDNMDVAQGDAALLLGKQYDIVLANINRNILLEDIKKYRACLNTGGILLLSGFYNSDIDVIDAECSSNKLKKITAKEDNKWVALSYMAF